LKKVVALFIFLLIAIFSCLKRPKLKTEFNVPLIAQTLKIREILDSNYLRIHPDSTLELFYQAKIDTFRVNDSLRIFNISDTFDLNLSDFIIENLITTNFTLTLANFTGFNLPDTTIPFEPFDTTLYGQELVFSGIEELNIVEMVMEFEVINFTQLGFDSILIDLPPIGNFSFPAIRPTQTITQRERVENVSLTDSIILADITIASPGSATPIRVSQYDSLRINIRIDSVRISSGTIRIPPDAMRAVRLGTATVPSNYRIHIDTLSFLAGYLTLTLQNQLPCPVRAFVKVNELSFDSTVYLSATSINQFDINLAGRSYINPNPEITPFSCSTAVIIEPTNQSIHFQGPENFNIAYSLFNPKISNFTGAIFDTIRSPIRPDTMKFNFPQQLSVTIEQAELEGAIVSGLGFQTLFYLNLDGHNEQGERIVIDTLIAILPGTPTNPRTTNFLLNVTPIINILPTKIIVTGYRAVTGNGHAEASSFITGAYSFSSPLRLAFDTSTVNFKPQEVNIEERYRDDIKHYLVSGEIVAQYSNHLPFGLTGELKIESPTANSVTIPFCVAKPEIDELTGIVTAPKETTITISLDQNQTDIFKQSTIYASASLFLPKTDTVTVTVRDYFSVDYSYCKLKLNLLK